MADEWNTKEFSDLVNTKIGAQQQAAMVPALESIGAKWQFCGYHKEEVERLMIPQCAAEEFYRNLLAARAHIIAFAQSLHATADYLAKVLHRGLDLSVKTGKPIKKAPLTLERVSEDMTGVAELAPTKAAIDGYRSSPSFEYLGAFVNTEKHHELVDAAYSFAAAVGTVPVSKLKLKAFQYKDTAYHEKSAAEFLDADFKAIMDRTCEIGCRANAYLAAI